LDHEYPHDESASLSKHQTSNYVDEFFPNFRDFSEFSSRRVDRPKEYDYFGYRSESKKVSVPARERVSGEKIQPRHRAGAQGQASEAVPVARHRVGAQVQASEVVPVVHRSPRNIQEVLEQEDESPSTPLSEAGTEPLIATF